MNKNPTATTTGAIVIGAVAILVVLSFVFKGQVHF